MMLRKRDALLFVLFLIGLLVGANLLVTRLANGLDAIHAQTPSGGSGILGSQTVASGTATMTTAAITAGTCGTTVTVANAVILATDTIVADFATAPNGTQAGLVAWATAGNANFAYCGIAETPAAMTVQWRDIR